MTGVSAVLIRDTPGRTTFEIKPTGVGTAEVRICVDDVLSASQVLAIEPSDLRELSGFFDELAQDWRGWSTPKIWKLPDERTSLEARHDGAGHITIVARLFPIHYDLDWQATATLVFEAGQLDDVAKTVSQAVYANMEGEPEEPD